MADDVKEDHGIGEDILDQATMLAGSAATGAAAGVFDSWVTDSKSSSISTAVQTGLLTYYATTSLKQRDDKNPNSNWGIKTLLSTYWSMQSAMAAFRMAEFAANTFSDFLPEEITSMGTALIANTITGGELGKALLGITAASVPGLIGIGGIGGLLALGGIGTTLGLYSTLYHDELQHFLIQMVFGQIADLTIRSFRRPGPKRPELEISRRTMKESTPEYVVNKIEQKYNDVGRLIENVAPTGKSMYMKVEDFLNDWTWNIPRTVQSAMRGCVTWATRPTNEQQELIPYYEALAGGTHDSIPENKELSRIVSGVIDDAFEKAGGYKNVTQGDLEEAYHMFYQKMQDPVYKKVGVYDRNLSNHEREVLRMGAQLELIRHLTRHADQAQSYFEQANNAIVEAAKNAYAYTFNEDGQRTDMPKTKVKVESTELSAGGHLVTIPSDSPEVEVSFPLSESKFLLGLRKTYVARSQQSQFGNIMIEPEAKYEFEARGYVSRDQVLGYPMIHSYAADDLKGWESDKSINAVLISTDPRILYMAKHLGMKAKTIHDKNLDPTYHVAVKARDETRVRIPRGKKAEYYVTDEQGQLTNDLKFEHKTNVEKIQAVIQQPRVANSVEEVSPQEYASTIAYKALYGVLRPAFMELLAMGSATAINWARKKLKSAVFDPIEELEVEDTPEARVIEATLNTLSKSDGPSRLTRPPSDEHSSKRSKPNEQTYASPYHYGPNSELRHRQSEDKGAGKRDEFYEALAEELNKNYPGIDSSSVKRFLLNQNTDDITSKIKKHKR